MGIEVKEIRKRIVDLQELNPMLGHRGCRLAITYPEIAMMQAKAIIQGAIEAKESGVEVNPEIMIPLVGEVKELKTIKENVIAVINEELEKSGVKVDYTVGTMIEVPRACLT
ncbi:MAG: putative PEP-binding protein, partial [Clostridium sp.]